MSFSHRNGEPEPSAQNGLYYFIGTLLWMSERSPYRGWVEVYNNEVYVAGTDRRWDIRATAGRWWGPIIPPPEEQ